MDVMNEIASVFVIFTSCLGVGWLMARLGWVKVIGITKGLYSTRAAIGPSKVMSGGAYYSVLEQATRIRATATTSRSSTWTAPIALRHSKAQWANSAGALVHSTLPRPLLAA